MEHPSSISALDFNYHLPPEKIAPYPLKQRDESKLLVYRNGAIREDQFKHLDQFLPENSLLVFNTTKVVHARLKFLNLTGRTIEIFCLEPHKQVKSLAKAMATTKSVKWNCMVGNLKKWKQEELVLKTTRMSLTAKIVGHENGNQVIDFSWQPAEFCFAEVLEFMGVLPIPPYFKRESDDVDKERYQTIYAKNEGSVAAPTAGLHFTDQVFKSLKKKNVKRLEVTLHVGAGTFMPVKSETMKDHEMHKEWMEVSAKLIDTFLTESTENVIAVGTTSLRTIESLYWMGVKAHLKPESTLQELEVSQWDPYELPEISKHASLTALQTWMSTNELNKLVCKTGILIAPPYMLKLSGGIITNFHQPQSTLLLLVSAIVGQKWKEIYTYALLNNFRFLSYGDSSLLLK
jgi:S-adenosylmethionine:tRNA ribosyltransferase-isomerase